jgi:predicted dehydrogenase
MVGTYNTLLCAKSDFRSRTFGALLVDYTHELDMLNSLFGEVKDVVCKANGLAHKAIFSDPSLAALLIEYGSGAVVSVHFDYVQHPQRRLMEIYGDRRTIEFDLQSDRVRLFDCGRPEVVERSFDNLRNERFVREHDDVIRAIRQGVSPRVDGAKALEALAVAERAIAH